MFHIGEENLKTKENLASKDIWFEEVIQKDCLLSENNPFAYDLDFIEKLYHYYKKKNQRKVYKQLKQRLIFIKMGKTAYHPFL